MARNVQRDEREMERRKNQLLDAGFKLFSENGIEAVSLLKVAETAEVGAATLYNYYQNKVNLVTAISARMWNRIWLDYIDRNGSDCLEQRTAYENIEAYADEIIRIYVEQPEVLRFSSDFKTFICREKIEMEQVALQFETLKPISNLFHECYKKAKTDKSVRMDISEQEIFTTVALSMLGMAERYAQGIVWAMREDNDYTKELNNLKEMLLKWVSGK